MRFKRNAAIGLAFVLTVTGCFGTSVWGTVHETDDLLEEYEVGAKLCGFTMIQESELNQPPALLQLWEHDKTGAKVYFVHNDDQDRAFSVAFRTEPSDDTGKLHILEHAVCAASEKYPGRDVFFDSAAHAYITDINAGTYKSATNYYASSMSEDQLERMADVFMDCAFHSAIRTEPKYFYREGWRYTMENAEDPLTIDGIVYNEMKGAYGDIYEKHYYHGLERGLYPDTYQRWDSGGDPETIPELTYEELIAFYDECYHPSNSVSMFYGDVETERYLKLLDEGYFSEYEAQDSAGYSKGQEPFAEPIIYEQEFPVSADSEQSNGIISYAVALPEGIDFAEVEAMLVGAEYLGDASSPLMDAFYNSGIGANYYVESSITGTQFSILFTADEADTSRAEEFQKLAVETLSSMIEEGFDQEMLDSIFAQQELENALVLNSRGIGVTMADRLAMAVDSGYVGILDESLYMEDVEKLCADGGLAGLYSKYILQNTHAALIITSPEPGLLEEQEAAEKERLAEIKAAMSQEEINQVIADTQEFNKWNEEGGSIPETLEKLRTEKPDQVNAEIRVYDVAVHEADGADIYTADVQGDAVYCEYVFDISHLAAEEIRVLDVYTELLGLSTEKRSQHEVSIAEKCLLSDLKFSIKMESREDGSVYPAFSMRFYALEDNLKEALELVREMFLHTDLSDNADYFSTAFSNNSQEFYSTEEAAASDGMAFNLALAESSDADAVKYALFGMEYYNWLQEWEGADTEELERMFAEIREKALVRENARVIGIGNAKTSEERVGILCEFLPEKSESSMSEDHVEYAVEKKGDLVAFKANGTASYLCSGVNIASLGLETTGELQLLLAILNNEYLLPEFRYQLGAYGADTRLEEDGIYKFKLYRAPSFEEALLRLPELPDAMSEDLKEMTEETLAGYQLSIISETTQPYGEWKEARNQIYNLWKGIEAADCQEILNQVCNATPETLTKALPELKEIMEAAGNVVLAPGTVVEESRELFDEVLMLP